MIFDASYKSTEISELGLGEDQTMGERFELGLGEDHTMRVDDSDAMRRAFESYMMSGGSGGIGPSTEATSTLNGEEEEDERMAYANEQRLKKWEKRSWTIFHKFANELKGTWLEIDEQTEQIVKSIAGIRSRLPMHAKLYDRFDRESKNNDLNSHSGYRHSLVREYEETSGEESFRGNVYGWNGNDTSETLNKKDVELAMSHDLIQHEKMMEGLRSLFSVLSESVDALSRHLDEILQHQFDSDDLIFPTDLRTSFLKASHLPEVMTDLFQMLSLETYRKQCLAHRIFETVVDAVMEKSGSGSDIKTDPTNSDWGDLGPRGVVDRCSLLWPRNSKHSEIDLAILNGVLDAMGTFS